MEAVLQEPAVLDADPVAWSRSPRDVPMTTATTDEARLVERLQAGDRQAFGELVRRYQRPVFYLVWRYVKNDEDAKDLTQAAFVRAWQAAPEFRGEASFRTWLYRIAVNLALNHLRDRGRWRTTPLPEEPAGMLASPDAPPVDRLVQAEASEQLRRAVEHLPPKQRLVVELRVQDGLSFREVADIAECSEDSAKANFHHALKRLRSLLGQG